MTQILHFDRWEGNYPRLQCVWNDELRFFPDEQSACRWARRQGLRAVFPEDGNGHIGPALADGDSDVSGAECGSFGSDALNPLYMYGIGYELEDG